MGWLSELLIGIGGGVVTAAMLTGGGWVLRLRRVRRDAAWFGARPGDDWLVLLPRYHADERSVWLNLVAALGEVVRLAESVDCTVTALPNDEVNELGELTEIAIGGAAAVGGRMATHLRTWVPAFSVEPWAEQKPSSLTVRIDGDEYPYDGGTSEYALLARFSPAPDRKPLFVVAAQGSRSDHAGAHYLRKHHRALRRRFGDAPFAILLHNRESAVYGPSLTEEVHEVPVART